MISRLVFKSASELDYYYNDHGQKVRLSGTCPPGCAKCCKEILTPTLVKPCPLLIGDKCTWQMNKPIGCILFPLCQENIDKWCPPGSWRTEILEE